MSNLTNQAPASTFGALMNTESTGGLTDILQVIQDGFGRPSPLSLSTDSLKINTQMGGGFFIDNVRLNATATQINSVCVDASFSIFTAALILPKGTTAQRPPFPQNGEIRYNTTISSPEMYADDEWTQIGTNSPNFSSFTTAINFPKGTTGQRPAPPENGDMRYNTTTNNFEGYKAGVWVNFDVGAAGYSPGSPTFLQDTFVASTFNLSVGSAIPNFTGRFESTIFGDDALQTLGAGSRLVGMGYRCLKSLTTANDVTGVGHLCLSSLTTGIYCTAFGKSSQALNQTGAYNVSMGALSLSTLLNGNSNTAIGHSSLAASLDDFNTAMGRDAGLILILGQENCFFGASSGTGLLNGSGNCFFGRNAGAQSSSYTNCTFLGKGSGAKVGVSSLTNACSIGFNSIAEVDNSIILGDATIPTKVGIGITNPTQILHVANGNAVFAGMLGVGTTSPSTRLHVKDGVSYFQNSNVGIGTATPAYSLDVVGNCSFQGTSVPYSGVILQQFSQLVSSGNTWVIDFPLISPLGAGNGMITFFEVKMLTIQEVNCAYAVSTVAVYSKQDGTFASVPPSGLPSITWIYYFNTPPTATWTFSGSNLRLSITADGGPNNFLVTTQTTRITPDPPGL